MQPIELKQIRLAFGFSQTRMSLMIGVSPEEMLDMEYGNEPIPKCISNLLVALVLLQTNGTIKDYEDITQ